MTLDGWMDGWKGFLKFNEVPEIIDMMLYCSLIVVSCANGDLTQRYIKSLPTSI